MVFWLKVSRPGLWFQTLWLYLVPLAGRVELDSPAFWLGLLYVTWPLNVMVYGWNDMVDFEVDQENPRKDSWLFGARGTRAQLDGLPPVMVAAQLPFLAAFVWLGGWKMAALMVGVVAVNATYNARIGGLRGRPPFDLVNPLGYLLVLQIAVGLNGVPNLPWQALVYLGLFVMHAQLMGEVMDFYPDRDAGRETTCTVLGLIPTKMLIWGLVVVEGLMCGLIFGDWVLGGLLLAAGIWLLLDAFVLYKVRPYTKSEFFLAGVGMNAAGLASMLWLWFNRSLLALP